MQVIKAEDPVAEYIDMLADKNYTDEGMEKENPAKVKGVLFGLLFAAGNVQQGPIFLIGNFKNGNVIIHKETIVFKVMKYFPASLMDDVMEKMAVEKEVLENGAS
jgi:hypothetical protein